MQVIYPLFITPLNVLPLMPEEAILMVATIFVPEGTDNPVNFHVPVLEFHIPEPPPA